MNVGDSVNKHIELLLRGILTAAENVVVTAKSMLEDVDITREELEQIDNGASRIRMNKSYISGIYENAKDYKKRDNKGAE